LDVFNEYEDNYIYDALRRVHLLRADEGEASTANGNSNNRNENVFKDLDSVVSEGGQNFS
jgi:hypothetical protein